MTKWGNLIKYRICKSICAEDYKGSASLNPQSDISPNASYINWRRTRRASLKRPCLHFLKRSLMRRMYVTGLQPQLWTLFSAPHSVKSKYFTWFSRGHFLISRGVFSFMSFFFCISRDLLNKKGRRVFEMHKGTKKTTTHWLNQRHSFCELDLVPYLDFLHSKVLIQKLFSFFFSIFSIHFQMPVNYN